jgi:hypothetical protein
MKKENPFLVLLKRFVFLILSLIVFVEFALGAYKLFLHLYGDYLIHNKEIILIGAIIYIAFSFTLYEGLDKRISGKKFRFNFFLFLLILIVLSIFFLLMKLSIY